MNCQQVQQRLAELVYEEPGGADDRAGIEPLRRHIEHCEACAAELAALEKTAGLLQTAAELDEGRPDASKHASLSVAGVYRKSNERALRARRRWRRAAVVLSAVAALLLLVVAVQAMSLRVEVHPSHLVIGWGAPSSESNAHGVAGREGEAPAGPRNSLPLPGSAGASPSPNITSGRRQDPAALLAQQQQQLEELDTLVRLIAAQQTADEREYHLLARELGRRIDRVDQTSDLRWRTVGRGMHNLYLTSTTGGGAAPVPDNPKGETP